MTPYGDQWRLLRRILAQEYNKAGAAKKVSVQEMHALYALFAAPFTILPLNTASLCTVC